MEAAYAEVERKSVSGKTTVRELTNVKLVAYSLWTLDGLFNDVKRVCIFRLLKVGKL